MSARVQHQMRGLHLDRDGEVDDDIHCTWIYDRTRPLQVSVRFDWDTVWAFARQLLADVVIVPSGQADVRFTPHDDMVRMELHSGGEQVALVFAANDLCAFLDESFTAVPEGAELVDVDAGIELLLSPQFRSAVR